MTNFELDITYKDYVEPCLFCNHSKHNNNTCDVGDGVCEGFEAFLTFMEEWRKKEKKEKKESKKTEIWVDCSIKGEISIAECGKCDLPCKQISKKARKSIHVGRK